MIRVGVLRGGPSSEYEVSLKSGEHVLKSLNQDKYTPVDVFIGKDGVWRIDGMVVTPDMLHRKIDVAFNALHGEYGEDGQVQHVLDHHAIPYTGSGKVSSALAMHKAHTKDVLKRFGAKVKFALHRLVHKNEHTRDFVIDLYRTFPHPAIIKPVSLGSSVGISIVHSVDELDQALARAFEVSDQVLVEEYIKGKEATVGVVENFRGQALYSLPPGEIIPHAHKRFFDYEAKYEGASDEIFPGNFSRDEVVELESAAREVHTLLGLDHYSRSDFIVTPRRGIYFLEVNTLPGLTGESLLPKALRSVGSSLPEFVEHVIQLAHGK